MKGDTNSCELFVRLDLKVKDLDLGVNCRSLTIMGDAAYQITTGSGDPGGSSQVNDK